MNPLIPLFFVHQLPFRFFNPLIWGAWGYILLLMVFDSLDSIKENFFGTELLFAITLSYGFFEGLRYSLRKTENSLSVYANPWNTILYMFGVGILTSVSIISVEVYAYFTWVVGYSTFTTELIAFNLIFGIAGLLYTGVYATFFLLFRQNEQLLAEEESRKDKLQAQWNQQLKLLQPSFLFESLEVLIPLAYQNSEKAEKLIENLSELYRYQLKKEHRELANLKEEWRCAQLLAEILEQRYFSALSISFFTSGIAYNQWLVYPGALLSALLLGANRLIVHPSLPAKIMVKFNTDHLEIEFPLHQKLQRQQEEEIKRLEKDLKRFSNDPLVISRAYGKETWKLPLVPEEAENDPTETKEYSFFSANF